MLVRYFENLPTVFTAEFFIKCGSESLVENLLLNNGLQKKLHTPPVQLVFQFYLKIHVTFLKIS